VDLGATDRAMRVLKQGVGLQDRAGRWVIGALGRLGKTAAAHGKTRLAVTSRGRGGRRLAVNRVGGMVVQAGGSGD
jgi:hypothetical protein